MVCGRIPNRFHLYGNDSGGDLMNQYERIISYINEFGSISPMEAFADLGITKLSTRVSEMRKDGIEFNQEWEVRKNRYGEKVRYMRYSRGW